MKRQHKFLSSRGWYQWYNDDYWCHSSITTDPKIQDNTNYGMDTTWAVWYELLGRPKIAPHGSLLPFAERSSVINVLARKGIVVTT
jgi:hypothetical protein